MNLADRDPNNMNSLFPLTVPSDVLSNSCQKNGRVCVRRPKAPLIENEDEKECVGSNCRKRKKRKRIKLLSLHTRYMRECLACNLYARIQVYTVHLN